MTVRLFSVQGLWLRIGLALSIAAVLADVPLPTTTTVTEEAHLFASDGEIDDRFGTDVALSGDTALISTAGPEGSAVYVFVRNGMAWTEQGRLVPSDGTSEDQFGTSVALAGSTAVVGASTDDTANGDDAGSAYVFVRDGTTWTEQAHLFASDGRPGDFFGTSVAVSGDTALVGAMGDDLGGIEVVGSAYVFVRDGVTWTEQAHIVPSDPTASGQFGLSVDLEASTALIGNPGADSALVTNVGSVDVFARNGTTWTEQARLFGSDAQTDEGFGIQVDLDGGTALVSADGTETVAGQSVGSVYFFVHNGTAWTEQAHLFASDGAALDFFGGWAALSGNTAVVTAIGDDTAVGANAGSAYVYIRTGTVWAEQARIFASDGVSADFLGISVALEGDTALVGAAADDTAAGVEAGSVYVYRISDNSSCTITGTEGNDALTGTDGDDVICGLGGNDRLSGRGGNDLLFGGAGQDVLEDGAGINTLDGGDGTDTATYSRAMRAVAANLEIGTANGPSTDTLFNIENLIGSNFDDRLIGDAGPNLLNGRRGNDRLIGGPGIDRCINGEKLIACEA